MSSTLLQCEGMPRTLWRRSLLQWLKGGVPFEVLFAVDRVKIWNAQLKADTELNGLLRFGGKLVPGIAPITVRHLAEVFIRETEGNYTVEVEIITSDTEGIWFVVKREDFDVFARSLRREIVRPRHRNAVRGDGMQRYKMYTRPRSPFF